MAQIQQVSTPIGNKGYNSTLDTNNNQNGEPFLVGDLNKTEQVQSIQGGSSGGVNSHSAGAAGSVGVPAASVKEPSLAVENVKDIINDELIASAKLNGYTELVGEIETLTKKLYLKPDELVDEIVSQEKQNTIFSGREFYNILRELSRSGSDTTKEMIGALLKGINFAQTKGDILKAISSNLRFLSDYFSANTKISDNLTFLADKWASESAEQNFSSLKSKTSALINQLSESILNDDKTQSLVPLITHNMSRFNTNRYMIKEAFTHLLTQIPNSEARENLVESFDALIRSIFSENELEGFVLPGSAENTNTSSQQETSSFGNSFTQNSAETPDGRNSAGVSDNPQNTSAATGSVNSGAAQHISQDGNSRTDNQYVQNSSSENAFGNLSAPQSDSGMAAGQNVQETPSGKTAAGATDTENTAELPYQYNNTTNDRKNQVGNSDFVKNSQLLSVSDYIKHIYSGNTDIERPSEADLDNYPFDSFVKSFLLGKEDGISSIRKIISGFLPDEPEITDMLEKETGQIKSLNGLVDYLNDILKNMPEFSKSQSVFEAFEEIVTGMARKNELPEQNPEEPQQNMQKAQSMEAANSRNEVEAKAQSGITNTMKSLTQYIEHNINHPALKTIDNFNASNLLQSILNAPGVLTPLSHYIIPLQIDVTKAFGELWVDNDSDSKNGGADGTKSHHLFLTFDVDTIGRFEVDIYARDKNLSMSILHPKSYTEKASALTDKISAIANASGYRSENVHTGVLKSAHTLTEVFPKLYETRSTFNVKA